MLDNPDLEQVYWSRTSQGVYEIAHDSIRLMRWICYHDWSYHENVSYYDLMGSVLKFLIEVSWWSMLRRSKRSSFLKFILLKIW